MKNIKKLLKNKKFVISIITLILLILNEIDIIDIDSNKIDSIVDIVLTLIVSAGFLLTDFKKN